MRCSITNDETGFQAADFALPSHAGIVEHPKEMKPSPWLIPCAAALLGGTWIAMQRNSAAELRREISGINERIRQARLIEEAEQSEQSVKAAKAKPIDWKGIAGKMRDAQSGGTPDMRAMIHMQRLLMDLSAAELCAHMDEIAALDMDQDTRRQLLGMVMGALVEKDPKLALDRFASELTNDDFGLGWQMGNALRKWADKDPAAAAAWLDRQIATGAMESKSLEGVSHSLVRFEASLAGALLKTDPAAATARISALTDKQREEFFRQGFFLHLEKGTEAAYAKLVRDTMPADKASGILADTAGNLVRHGNFERVDSFIATSKASDEEKQKIIGKVLATGFAGMGREEIDIGKLEKARDWAKGHMPAAVDKATGDALAQAAWHGKDFDAVAGLAVQYSEAAGNDEALAAFLKGDGVRRGHAKQAAALIAKIKDPALRAEISGLAEYKEPDSEP